MVTSHKSVCIQSSTTYHCMVKIFIFVDSIIIIDAVVGIRYAGLACARFVGK